MSESSTSDQMADWFKFRNDCISEPRMQSALNEEPFTLTTFLGVLSECSRHQSDTIPAKPANLKGLAAMLRIPVEKVEHALSLLVEIEYIDNANQAIRVIRWNEQQSEYCRRKQRGTLPQNEAQAADWASMQNVPKDYAVKVFNQLEGRDWMDGAGQRVTNFRAYIASRYEREVKSNGHADAALRKELSSLRHAVTVARGNEDAVDPTMERRITELCRQLKIN